MARLYLLLSLAIFSLASVHAGDFDEVAALKTLCAKKQIDITKTSQVKSLIELIERVPLVGSECPEEVKTALLDLKPVVDDVKDVCSNIKVEALHEYYMKHIQNVKADSGSRPLRQFFLAFGFKSSEACKKNMISALMYDAHKVLVDSDFETMKKIAGGQSFLNDLLKTPNDYDDLMLTSELARLTGSSGAEDDRLFIQTATSDLIYKIKSNCDKRYRPIYEKLISPLISMSNIGFNYQGPELKKELEEMGSNEEVHMWYRIVFICDSVGKLVVVEDREASSKVEGSDGKVIRVFTPEEVCKLEENGQVVEKSELNDLEQVTYDIEGTQIEDLVLDKNDSNLMKLVDKFAPAKTEDDRIRSKFLRRIGSFVKDFVLNGKVKLIGSIFGKSNEAPSAYASKEDVVRSIDEYIQDTSSSQGDSEVSGVRDYAKRQYQNQVFRRTTAAAAKRKADLEKKNKFHIGKYLWHIIAISLLVIGIVCISMAG